MRIEHIAIWTYNIEGLRNFYMHYFGASSGNCYYNHSKEFRSYYLTFDDDCRLELMEMPNIPQTRNNPLKQFTGLVHFAIKTGSKQAVDHLTELLRHDGFKVVGEPRTTGEGHYESVILDPDGNRVELIA